jgi:hypothetical protein
MKTALIIGLIIGAALVGLTIGIRLGGRDKAPLGSDRLPLTEPDKRPSPANSNSPPLKDIGYVCLIRGPGGSYGAVDEMTWKSQSRLLDDKADRTYAELEDLNALMVADVVFIIPAGSRIQVMGYGAAGDIVLYRVRVLTGRERDKAGFIKAESLL